MSNSFVELRLCKLSSCPTGSQQPVIVTHYVIVNSDLTWSVNIHNHLLNLDECTVLQDIPQCLCPESLNLVLERLNKLNVCSGHRDPHFVSMLNAKKGKVTSSDGKIAAYVDSPTQATIRTTSCNLLTTSKLCPPCATYRNALRAMYSRWCKRCTNDISTDRSSHSNERYLSAPEKVKKMNGLKQSLSSRKS